MNRKNPLPREIAPGVHWIGDCLELTYRGKAYHGYNAAFLVVGEEAAMMVETGHPKDFLVIEQHLDGLLARTQVPLRHLFITHQETPHSGSLGRLLARYPDVTVHGDISDYHLAFPQFADRLRSMEVGDAVDLGGRRFVAVEPVIRDMKTSLWGFDTGADTLFPGDGFAFSHYHLDGHCGLTAEEATSLDLPEMSAVFAELALYWTTFCDMTIYCDRLEAAIDELGVKVLAPTHGLPILDIPQTMPKIRDGLISASGQAA